MNVVIAQLMQSDTCYCPLCGSKIVVPLSNLDQELAMQPKSDCCRDWYAFLSTMVEETEREMAAIEPEMSEEESEEGLSALFV